MKHGLLLAATAAFGVACQAPGATKPVVALPTVEQHEPPLVVATQPPGQKQCVGAPLDYPDPPASPRPARVAFASLPPDPVFRAMGVTLVTFRRAELVFHVSPDLPQAVVDCTVAAADDAVAFVTRALAVPRVFDGGPTRDVFLLSPNVAEDVLEHLDPGHRFAVSPETGATFVGSPLRRPLDRAIFQWKSLPVSYLRVGFMYAHEWVHMIQAHTRGSLPKELDVVVEGEANLLATLFQDATVPGSGSLFWDLDARRLAKARAEHPELTLQDLLTQRPHLYHEELSLFAYIGRAVDPPTLAHVRLLGHAERIDYATAWKRVVGRELIDDGLEAVVRSPSLSPRPALSVSAPTLTILRNEKDLWFIAPGFRAGERVTRSVRLTNGHVDTDEVEADSRGVVGWTWRLRAGARYAPRDITLQGAPGTATGRYYDREAL